MKRAFVFPGQGSQTVGMGKALGAASGAAREVFGNVDEALGQNLFRLMCEGPQETLTLTENAQPAIMAVSLAVMGILDVDAGICISEYAEVAAGHSLGEYSALAALGSLDVGTTAKLLKQRGVAMQEAVPVGVGSMAALLGVDMAEAEAIVAEAAHGQICTTANDNALGQIVISGHKEAVERAVVLAKARGKKAMPLSVSAPFHCALMQPAADAMAKHLATAPIIAPVLPLIANVTAAAVAQPDAIRALLIEQITAPVRWRESVETMIAMGCESFIEIGAGKALSGMIKRINRDVNIMNIESPDDIEAFLKTI